MTTNATAVRPNTPGFAPPGVIFRELVNRAFNQTLPAMGYTVRQPQVDYALHVANEMLLAPRNPEKAKVPGLRPNLGLIEGPTGIGKTQGYLIPILLWIALALKAGVSQRALVSTHTLALMDQIMGPMLRTGNQPSYNEGDRSDLAVALEVVRRLTGVTLTAAFRKGKQAYIDADRAQKILAPLAGDAEAAALLGWLATFPARPDEEASEADHAAFFARVQEDRRQGLLSSWVADGHELPEGIEANDLVMNGDSGPDVNPWYEAAKDDARTRDIVVVTHTMVLVDILAQGRVLSDEGVGPAQDFTFLVHDEADMLVGVAESFSRHKVRPITIRGLLKDHRAPFSHLADDQGTGSALATARDALRASLDRADAFLSTTYSRLLEAGVFGKNVRTKEHLLAPQGALAAEAITVANDLTDALRTLAKLLVIHQGAMPPKVARSASLLQEGLTEAADHLTRFVRILSATPNNDEGSDVPSVDYRMTALAWSPKKALASLEVLRMDPGRMFAANWMGVSQHRYVLLTSATLRVPARGKGNEWGYIINALGAHAVVDPQAYEPSGKFGTIDRIVLSVLAGQDKKGKGPFLSTSEAEYGDDTSAPYNPRWQALAVFGARRMAAAGGCGLLLAPSYKDIEWMATSLNDDPAFWWHRQGTPLQEGIEALQQGRARILVTPAAWAGYNIRALGGGQILRHIGILRLPYPPPDPTLRACYEAMFRRRGKKDPKNEASSAIYMRGQALALHKTTQGFGRGIRDTHDTITLWVLDPRVHPHSDVIRCGDPRLLELSLEAVGKDDMWHRALPKRFRQVLEDAGRMTLLVAQQDRDDVVEIVPDPGVSASDCIL